MSVAEAPVAADLDLRESSLVVEEGASAVGSDGTVRLHIIRPGIGKGRGRHLYEARMLQENATKFAGWKMYVNHLAPEAKKAAGGLPRDVRDLGGRITESYWDPNVPANTEKGWGQGAVVGVAKPTPFIRELIENDPEIVEASISATATGVRPGTDGGQRCWIVEGIEDRGSVDWVTEAGAGGRVVSLMEAAYAHDTEGRLALLASMDDDEFASYVSSERPALAEALKTSAADDKEDAKDGGADEEAEGEKKPKAKKLKESTTSEEDTMPMEALIEALSSEDHAEHNALVEALTPIVEEVAEEKAAEIVEQRLPALVEAAVEAERDLLRATTRADADRRVSIERMRSEAHKMVEATRLPEPFKADLKSKFDLSEAGDPTPALDVVDKINDDGEVEQKASDVLKEAVTEEIKHAQALVAAANPTRVVNQGPSGGTDGETAAKTAGPTLAESLLQEAGFEDPSKVYDAAEAAKVLQS